jgi:hypothetical protein
MSVPAVIRDIVVLATGESSASLQPAGERLRQSEQLLGRRALRLVFRRLLDWLGKRAQGLHDGPLALSDRHPWCWDVRLLFEEPGDLASIFVTDGHALHFAPEVAAQTVLDIERFVAAHLWRTIRSESRTIS